MAKTWSEVEQSEEYQTLPPQSKIAAKQQYWNEVVAQKPEFSSLAPQQQVAAKNEFFSGLPTIDNNVGESALKPIGYSRSGVAQYDPIALARAKQETTTSGKAKLEGEIAASKENEVAIGKANRLEVVGNRIKDEWLRTSPYKGAITKTGLVPILGMWDVVKKGIGATDAQQEDQAYSNFVQGVRAQLARGMGDVGNLSEYEQKAVVGLVPSLMDSYESGIKKVAKLARLVEDIRSTRNKQGYSEFTVGGKNYKIPKDKVKDFMKAKGL